MTHTERFKIVHEAIQFGRAAAMHGSWYYVAPTLDQCNGPHRTSGAALMDGYINLIAWQTLQQLKTKN